MKEKTGEAVIQKSIAIEMLKEVADKDSTGFVKRILANAERMYLDMQNKNKNAAALRKNLDYNGYLNRRASLSAMNEMEMNFDDAITDTVSANSNVNIVGLNTSVDVDDDANSPPTPIKYLSNTRNRRLS